MVVRIQCRDGAVLEEDVDRIDISVRARAPSALGRGILNIAIHLYILLHIERRKPDVEGGLGLLVPRLRVRM